MQSETAHVDTVLLHRSARTNKYDGFRVPPVSDRRAATSKVKPRKDPFVPCSSSAGGPEKFTSLQTANKWNLINVYGPCFLELVQATWDKYCYAPNSAALLCKKLKNLRYTLKKWSKNISCLNLCTDNSNWALLELDNIEDKRALTIPEANFRGILKDHLVTLPGYKQQYWKKRYTVRWFKCGGDNTKFFHSAASERYRKNSIASLKLQDGTVVSDHAGKAKELFETYKERLGRKTPYEMKFDLARIIKKVEGLDELTKPFTHEEIDKVVQEMPANRAPGPDGFNGCFLKSC
ncbi:uncharacterized protein [Aegilops tauschii subsp. strangulata]|uniref:uncharacterized protein n=1 Tax=Aegilops tauschii subsp. strangulata TaxID=200361 RepID=UPI003CC844F3